MISRTVILTLGTSLLAAAALAHSGATGVVKERMDAMDTMGDAIKRIAPMFQGELGYDADAVRDAAAILQSYSGETMSKLFPKGSNAHPSEAKDNIWTNWDVFSALAGQLEAYSEGLSMAADNGLSDSGGLSADTMMGGGSMMSADTMMGGGSMMSGEAISGASTTGDELAKMPTDAVFTMVSQTCSACHTRFRADD